MLSCPEMSCIKSQKFKVSFDVEISLVGHAGFEDGKDLLEQLVADGNQGHFALLAFSDESII